MDNIPAAAPRRSVEMRRGASEARSGPLRVFMFRATGRRVYALSIDPAGRNIPHGLFGATTWTYVRVVDLVAGEVRPGFDPDEVALAIAEDGYALIGSPSDAD